MPRTQAHGAHAIRYREGDRPGARISSGRLVFDENLMDGRLVSRYWNPNGQVWPEMHFGGLHWNSDQPADTFRLAIDGRELAGGYTWEGAALAPDPSNCRARLDAAGNPLPVSHGAVELAHAQAGVGVRVHTRVDGSPFVVRWLEITNRGAAPVGITGVAPFAGCLWSHRAEEHTPAGAAGPFELAYNHQFEWGREGDFWFETLADGRKVVDGERRGRSGWGRPAFWARNRCNGQTFVCELAWGGNYAFELDCRLRASDYGWVHVRPGQLNAELYFAMGLSGCEPVLRVLEPGETVTTPAVHMALFQDGFDAIVQATHEHVRSVVMPAQIPGRHIEIEANHRGYLCDRENVADILKDVDVAAAIGADMYVIDAGWYGNEPNHWGDNVGDWHDGPWMAEGGGLKAVVDAVHARDMRFGLWVEIEAAGANSALRRERPEWLLRRNGEPVAGGRALDLTNPEVLAFEEGEIARLIRDLELDMYRIDHNHTMQPFGNRTYAGFTEDLTWRYYDNLYAMFDRLRAANPGVVFQNCAGGGGRLDWGTLARFHNTELSDWMRMPRGLRILNGVTMSLPPEILLRTFGTEVGEHALEGDLVTQLRLCMCRIIFRGIAPSVEELTPYLREHIVHWLDIYRTFIRPLMPDARVFHHTPFQKHAELAPWCALELASADATRSAGAVFRTADTGESTFVFRPRGLDADRTYQVTRDNTGTRFHATGRELERDGIRVTLDQPQTSELLLFDGQGAA